MLDVDPLGHQNLLLDLINTAKERGQRRSAFVFWHIVTHGCKEIAASSVNSNKLQSKCQQEKQDFLPEKVNLQVESRFRFSLQFQTISGRNCRPNLRAAWSSAYTARRTSMQGCSRIRTRLAVARTRSRGNRSRVTSRLEAISAYGVWMEAARQDFQSAFPGNRM